MYPSATITGVDTPTEHWYTAVTTTGEQATGVRLYGIGIKFNVGQKVIVFQCGTEYGFAEKDLGYPSQLTIPDAQKASVAMQAPASVALAYIAKLAGNDKIYYIPGTVVEKVETFKLRVTSTMFAGEVVLSTAIPTNGFYAGARVLIRSHPYKPQVLGWWNSLYNPEEDDKPEWWTEKDEEWWEEGWWSNSTSASRKSPIAIAIGRIPFSANIDIRMYDQQYNVLKSNIFRSRDKFSNMAFLTDIRSTTNDDDYYYVIAWMGIYYGMLLEKYWLKIHKKTFEFIELTEAEYPPFVPTPYHITANNLSWRRVSTAIYVQPVGGGEEVVAYNTGPTDDYWLPVQDYHYRTDIFVEP